MANAGFDCSREYMYVLLLLDRLTAAARGVQGVLSDL